MSRDRLILNNFYGLRSLSQGGKSNIPSPNADISSTLPRRQTLLVPTSTASYNTRNEGRASSTLASPYTETDECFSLRQETGGPNATGAY